MKKSGRNELSKMCYKLKFAAPPRLGFRKSRTLKEIFGRSKLNIQSVQHG